MLSFVVLALLCLTASAVNVNVKCSGIVSDVQSHRSYEFDLSSLHHDETVYIDSLWYRTDENKIYYVNFCGQTASACDADDTSVCIRSPDGQSWKYTSGGSTSTQTISIAEAQAQSPNSSVTVTYSNGEKCGNGYYKTKIYINCMETANPGYFYNIEETNECEATLYMWAAAGCGKEVPYVDPSSSAASSAVTSSSSPGPLVCGAVIRDDKDRRAYKFDLTPLHHDSSTYVDPLWYRTDDNKIYYVNFCGQTASACESNDTSVCIRTPDGEDWKYSDGGRTSTQKITIAEAPGQSPSSSVTVTYSNGDKCGDGNYKTKIYINCQQTANPGFFYGIDEKNECEATLYMWSASGCGKDVPYVEPSSVSSVSSSSEPGFCSGVVKDEKNHRAYKFDLSMLHHDEKVHTDPLWYRTDDNTIFYVNFCGQTAAACKSDDASVCIRIPDAGDYRYDVGGKTSTQNISIAESPEQSPSSSVTVTYSDGDKCGNGNYKTKIYVNCQPTAIPGYFYKIVEPNRCEVTLFMWSAAGCGEEVPYPEANNVHGFSSSSGRLYPLLSVLLLVLIGAVLLH